MFAPLAFFQSRGIEFNRAAHLGDIEFYRAQASVIVFVFKTIGMALALFGALIRLGLQGVGSFDNHGFVNEDAQDFGQSIEAVVQQELHNRV